MTKEKILQNLKSTEVNQAPFEVRVLVKGIE